MLSELGHFAAILALFIAALQATLPLWGAQYGDRRLMAFGDLAAIAGLALLAFSFFALMQAYIASDYSLINVYKNSHHDKPLIYKIAGTWGNHEGSLLLWVLILALFSAAIVLWGRYLPKPLRARVLSVQGMISFGFLAFLLLTSNPFLRQFPVPMSGQSLNPLLQDIGLALHPPMLYLGYVGLSVTFSFAAAALIEGRVDPAWGRWVRPWTLAAWIFLTIGIALGSWWAYYELGWGGWWFWDPVENVSFMPWLAATALLHSAIVVEKRDSLKSWTILLAILAFSLSLVGTFIVRSGLLTSVHAFAVDPERGVFILLLLALAIIGSFALYAWRAPVMREGAAFSAISRESALLLNNVFLFVCLTTVFVGTLYPLFLEMFTGNKISVGEGYYNFTFVPLAVPLLLLMAAGPYISWRRADLLGVMQRLLLALGLSVLGVFIFLGVRRGYDAALSYFGLFVALWIISASLIEWGERVRLFRGSLGETWMRIKGLPRAGHGMTLAHMGLGVAVIGMVGSSYWSLEALSAMKMGETLPLGQHCARFEGVAQGTGPNYSFERGKLVMMKDCKSDWFTLLPEKRAYKVSQTDTTEAAIHTFWHGDYYAALGDLTKEGQVVRLWYRAVVPWLWVGAGMLALGGLLSLSDRRLRLGLPKRKG